MRLVLDKELSALDSINSTDLNCSQQLAVLLLAETHAIFDEDVKVNCSLGACGEKPLKSGDIVMAHCSAGALATAGHGTALNVIRSAVEAGTRVSVVANETRPFLQGVSLIAW